MTLEAKKAHSLAEMLSLADAACGEALSAGLAVDLVVGNAARRDARKLMLRSSHPTGVHAQTYDEWVEGLWDLYGDGRRIVAPVQRRVLLRPLVVRSGLLGNEPSAKFVRQLAEFVSEATSPAAQLENCHVPELRDLVRAYEEELDGHGLVEQAQAEALLAGLVSPGRAVVLEGLGTESPHRARFVRLLSERVPVTRIDRELAPGLDALGKGDGKGDSPYLPEGAEGELAELRRRLYTGTGGLRATGAVAVGEARGAHAEDAVLCALVQRFLDAGAAPGEVAVVFPDAADSYPHAQEALASAGIPFAARFELPAGRTPYGAAFAQLAGLRSDPDGPGSYEQLAGLATTPYAGIDGHDARALQMRWRERAGSTPEERLADIREGFAQGNADAKTTRERLRPLAELLKADLATCARLMFAHAREANRSEDALCDDAAAARAILGYLEACEELGVAPDASDMGSCAVPLERGFGDPDDAVALVDAGSFAPGTARCLVVPELDARHYPMARQPGPFDTALEELGIARPDDTAIEQRIGLLDLIESAPGSIAFCRATHDLEGAESVQSALWDELMSVYRGESDEAEKRAIQDIPDALGAFAVRRSEAGIFGDEGDGSAPVREVVRGRIENADELPLLVYDLAGKEMPFSPTGLEDYYRCPYRWFACRRVGYNGMDNEFDASAQGNLAHATMERFYRKLKGQGAERVTPENLGGSLELLSEALDEQVAHDEGRNHGGIFLRTEQDRYEVEEIRAMLSELVRRDADFLPGFVPTYFELTLGKGTGAMLEYAGVPVRGKVDRIDVDAAGNAVIIDYKLSGLSAGYGLDPDHDVPGRIQTDIYARLVQRHFDRLGEPLKVVGSVYRSYSKNCLRGAYARSIEWGPTEGISRNRDALPRSGRSEDYDEYLDLVEGTVAGCMERLHAGHIEPDPLHGDTRDVCEYCKAASFCPRGGK